MGTTSLKLFADILGGGSISYSNNTKQENPQPKWAKKRGVGDIIEEKREVKHEAPPTSYQQYSGGILQKNLSSPNFQLGINNISNNNTINSRSKVSILNSGAIPKLSLSRTPHVTSSTYLHQGKYMSLVTPRTPTTYHSLHQSTSAKQLLNNPISLNNQRTQITHPHPKPKITASHIPHNIHAFRFSDSHDPLTIHDPTSNIFSDSHKSSLLSQVSQRIGIYIYIYRIRKYNRNGLTNEGGKRDVK